MKYYQIKIFFSLICLFCASLHVLPERVALLREIDKPQAIAVDQNKLYVTQQATVFIYSLKNYTLLKKFGRQGEGPEEFSIRAYRPLGIDVSTDQIIINSLGKISYFNKSGVFIREVRSKSLALRLIPLGSRFLGWSRAADKGVAYATINIYDSALQKIVEIYRVKDSFQGPGSGYVILDKAFVYRTYRDKIILPGKDDATIVVLDSTLKKYVTIPLTQKKSRVTSSFKQRMIKFMRDSPETKEVYPMIKPLIFPAFFPTIADFFVEGGTIYVMTWKRQKDGNEFYTYSISGRFMKKLYIPIRYETDLKPYPVLVQQGDLYQLVENDNESWELHRSRIK